MKFIITNSDCEGFSMTAIKDDKAIKTVDFMNDPENWSSVNDEFQAISDSYNFEKGIYCEISFKEAKSLNERFAKYKWNEFTGNQPVLVTPFGKKINTYSHMVNYINKI